MRIKRAASLDVRTILKTVGNIGMRVFSRALVV